MRFVQRLVEQALPPDDGRDPIFLAAAAAEADAEHDDDWDLWDSLSADGLES